MLNMSRSEVVELIKKDYQVLIAIVVTFGFISFLMVGFWIITDPSGCKSQIPKELLTCQEFGWGLHILEISLPIMVTIGCWRMFRDDPKEQSQASTKSEPGFDYSKMGANDGVVQPSGEEE